MGERRIEFELEDVPKVARELLGMIRFQTDRPIVIGFSGGLGMGKTTLIRELVGGLGAVPEVTSPTFDLIHVHDYEGGIVVHADLYRLTDKDVRSLDLEHYLHNGTTLMVLEWPERAPEFGVDIEVCITAVGPTRRCLEIMFKNLKIWEPARQEFI